jgi:glutathione S-transferase
VRWALEEAGVPYKVTLIDPEIEVAGVPLMQPFGQVPIYEEDGMVLFESGAIVIHIAETSEVLMPRDAAGRACDLARLRGAEFDRAVHPESCPAGPVLSQ